MGRRAEKIRRTWVHVRDGAGVKEASDLFVMVRGIPIVWRLIRYDEKSLYLRPVDWTEPANRAPFPYRFYKSDCRVGTAREWRESPSHARAWREGGGEKWL